MSVFYDLDFGNPGPRIGRRGGKRAAAEEYAAALGFVRGEPGWGDAIREFVMHGPTSIPSGMRDSVSAHSEPAAVAWAERTQPSVGQFLRATVAADDEPRYDLHVSPQTSLGDPIEGGLEPASSEASGAGGLAIRRADPPRAQPRYRGRTSPLTAREIAAPIPGTKEYNRKQFDWRTWMLPDLSPILPPKRHSESREGDLQKRHFTTRPRYMDSDRVGPRIAEAIARLPRERRAISQSDRVALTNSPVIDRYYATMLAKERGIESDGTFNVSGKKAVGPGQVQLDTAREAANRLGITLDERRFREDRAYNEMIGQSYYASLVRDLEGDYVKAAAAYNAALVEPATLSRLRPRLESPATGRNIFRGKPVNTLRSSGNTTE